MLDARVSLAFSVHSNKGAYALLLGSGVSRASGVPTGWEIVLDLIRKLALVEGEDPGAEPEVWYRSSYSRDADYSDLLDALTRSPEERSQLLRSYFEPSEEERGLGLKVPTAAHRAIAKLVQAGFIRIIITTNFDKLIEYALADLGVAPTVISTPEAAAGCLPLAHSRCTVVKVHGDYPDSRLKNTKLELATYSDSMNQLLDRIFDEYGLIICGWSGAWDAALRASLERCRTHRFGTFWSVVGELPSSDAQRLISLRKATPIRIDSADKLFTELVDNVLALESFGEVQHPLSASIAVVRLKKYLSAGNFIQVRDLLATETERAFRAFAHADRADGVELPLGEEIVRRRRYYEYHLSPLLEMCIVASFWSVPDTDRFIVDAFRRIAQPDDPNTQDDLLRALRRYPALVLLYGVGLATLATEDYRMLGRLLPLGIRPVGGAEKKPVVEAVSLWTFGELCSRSMIPGEKDQLSALSSHLERLLRNPLLDIFPDEVDYRDAFDWFEYLNALVFVNITTSPEWLIPGGEIREPEALGPIGCFVWRRLRSTSGCVAECRFEGGKLPEQVARILSTGLFGCGQPANLERFKAVRDAFTRFLRRVAR